MCGIAGICRPRDRARDDRDRLQAMSRVLLHRGPDEHGIYISPERMTGLVHRRLSIVDLSSGHQPMSTADRRTHIVYNGEIYNHSKNRAALEADGVEFSTQSDTESILYLYRRHGQVCVNFLRGMFAFAIWDEDRNELFIARDRLGIKPLYYHLAADGTLVFGSEIKAILESGVICAELNVAAMPDYLANRSTSDNRTLFDGVFRLEPGHTLTWKDGRISIERYWNVANVDQNVDETMSIRDCASRWLELFEESVRLRLMSDVPLGMFLSGGIDSSAIASVMSNMVSDPIKTFSVAFNVPEANELAYARQVASELGTDHHEVIVEPEDFMAAVPHLIYQEDEPIAHSASIPLYFVSELARRYVKVVLTGEGSDELLGGYLKYPKTLMNLRLGRGYHRMTNDSLRHFVRRVLDSVSPASLRRKLRRTFFWLEPDIESIYFDNFAVFNRNLQSKLICDDFRVGMDSIEPCERRNRLVSALSSRNKPSSKCSLSM